MNFTIQTVADINESNADIVKQYLNYILSEDFYHAKELYKANNLIQNIISAHEINVMSKYIMDEQKDILLNGTDWIYYNIDIPTQALNGDYALK